MRRESSWSGSMRRRVILTSNLRQHRYYPRLFLLILTRWYYFCLSKFGSLHPLVSRTVVRLLAIFLLNVHANSAWMISSSSSAITPGTCSINKSYPPQHRQSSVTSRGHTDFSSFTFVLTLLIYFEFSCEHTNACTWWYLYVYIPLVRYYIGILSRILCTLMNIHHDTALVFLRLNCTSVLAHVNCYPPQDMSTTGHRFRLVILNVFLCQPLICRPLSSQ